MSESKPIFVAYCPVCGSRTLYLMPVEKITDPFSKIMCSQCHKEYKIDQVPRERM